MAASGETRSVFISHSCKDSETAPADADADASARWARLEYARAVRAAVRSGLERRGYTVLIDTDDLRPGGHWRPELHSWLGTCDGAVVLLDEDSVQSDWVRKEATILTWRAQLGSALALVPVFLPGFGATRLSEAGLDPLGLDEIQAVTAGELAADRVAELVIEQFADLPADTVDTPMRRWFLAVANRFKKVEEPFIWYAADKLGVTEAEYGQFTERHLTLAHHLLHVDLVPALACLREASKGMSDEDLRKLVALVTPIWVSHEAAQHLHSILCKDDAKPPLLAVEDWRIGGDYLQRAHCCELDNKFLITFPDKVGEDPADAVRRLEHSLAAQFGIALEQLAEDPEQIDSFLRWSRANLDDTYYAFVGPAAVRPDVLDALEERFGATLKLVLLGGPAASVAPESLGATLVRPPLSPEAARDALNARLAAGMLVAS